MNRQTSSVSPAPTDEPAWAEIARHWSFAPGVTFLNHGSFGSPPAEVLAARQQLLHRLSQDPVDFLQRFLQPALAEVRARLGAFLGADPDRLAFVENATVGMNAVACSVPLRPGDEVLLSDHEYGAVTRIWQRACARADARLVIAPLAVPAVNAELWVDTLMSRATDRTRLIVVSHVSSPTALILPVEAICRRARALGIPVCVDGPHGLVAVPFELDALDCDYYTASCQKWLLATVGSGFLYVHPRAQGGVRSAIESWGVTQGQPASWRDEFNWTGTRDPTSLLVIPAAIDFLERIGVEAFRQRSHYLAQMARQTISDWTGQAPLCPDDTAWYASMASLPLPPGEAMPLQDALWQRHRIEVPIFEWLGQRLVRVSCQMYTSPSDIERLSCALQSLLEGSEFRNSQ
ncbi:MAG TPA: aminotransferase class V-fold PLP-dependent enzyme [Pirellulales bacterium]|jgi:isopenicillin-N epimerase